jgi:hypothetical protein
MIPGPSDLRAEIARQQRVLYELAAQIRVHPGRLGMMLGEKIPMPASVAERLSEALKVEAAAT